MGLLTHCSWHYYSYWPQGLLLHWSQKENARRFRKEVSQGCCVACLCLPACLFATTLQNWNVCSGGMTADLPYYCVLCIYIYIYCEHASVLRIDRYTAYDVARGVSQLPSLTPFLLLRSLHLSLPLLTYIYYPFFPTLFTQPIGLWLNSWTCISPFPDVNLSFLYTRILSALQSYLLQCIVHFFTCSFHSHYTVLLLIALSQL